MTILHKSIELELKSLTDTGHFSGYGSVFSTPDKVRDIVEPGAFEKSLRAWSSLGRTVPALWQHQKDQPIGHWPELKEDDHGLFGGAELWLDDAPYARLAHKGMKTKSITGLSIGYRVKRNEMDRKSGHNRLLELDLVEISVVTNPAHDDARIADVKSMIESGRRPTIREFEDYLRDVGFSKSEAACIVAGGYAKLLSRGEPGGEQRDAALRALREFKLTP